jgi:hypothetical protein
MLDLQSALNVGEGFFYDSERWMEDEIDGKRRELDVRPDWPIYAIEPGRREACIIDPLLGTSTKLLSVLVLNLDNLLIIGQSSQIITIFTTASVNWN